MICHFRSPLLKLFPREIEAVTIFNHVFLRHEEHRTHRFILNHERIHVCQMKRDGYVFFYLKYFLEYIKNRFKGMGHWRAYRQISYEVEAYSHQTDLGYLRDEQTT